MQTQTQTLGVNPPLVVQIAASIMYTSLVRYYELDIHLSLCELLTRVFILTCTSRPDDFTIEMKVQNIFHRSFSIQGSCHST